MKKDKTSIFACGTDQITSATTILSQTTSNISSLASDLLSNFSNNSKQYLEEYQTARASSTGDPAKEQAKDISKAYYKDRCLTIMVFLGVVFIIKLCNDISYKKLRSAVNNSECSIEQHLQLTKEDSDFNSTTVNVNKTTTTTTN